jgi:glycine/D-amino acid oxidase-like deaminating enzyme
MLITKRFSPFEETLWWDTASPAPMTTELEGKKTANVCIVGAGYNGLTTRIELARKGVGVELLEAREAGFGCSGCNAGHCAPTFTYFDLPELCLLLGELWAERLIHRQTWANDRVSAPVERYQIQCEWQQRGYIQAAHRLTAISALQKKVSDYNAVGAKPWFLDRHEVEELTGSPHFHGG